MQWLEIVTRTVYFLLNCYEAPQTQNFVTAG